MAPFCFACAKVGIIIRSRKCLQKKLRKAVPVEYFFVPSRWRNSIGDFHSDSSAVGSVLRSGRRGREFESPLSDRPGRSFPAFLCFPVTSSVFAVLHIYALASICMHKNSYKMRVSCNNMRLFTTNAVSLQKKKVKEVCKTERCESIQYG